MIPYKTILKYCQFVSIIPLSQNQVKHLNKLKLSNSWIQFCTITPRMRDFSKCNISATALLEISSNRNCRASKDFQTVQDREQFEPKYFENTSDI